MTAVSRLCWWRRIPEANTVAELIALAKKIPAS
jgi:hypothetical protein